ncbi:MAG: hypothetical protein AB7V18_19470 [Pyrinomonadaceae bacterium]
MFDPTLDELLREIEEAERVRDQHLAGVDTIIREYTGRWYSGSRDPLDMSALPDVEGNPEPFAYSFVSNILPALVYSNPSAVVKAKRVVGHKMVQDAMQSGMRAWIQDVNFQEDLERVVLDFLFFQGILMHYIEDDERWAEGAVRPAVSRIDYRNWGCDSLASSLDEAAFQYHWYYADYSDIMADPALVPEALEKLRPNNDMEQKGPQRDPFKKGEPGKLGRKRVRVYSVWNRQKDTIRVVTRDPKLELYPERPYYGPKTGPYSVYQAYPVPGQVYPLSPLVAVAEQVKDLQVHAKAAARSAAGRKTVVIVDSTHANLAEDLHNSEDREVIAVPGFSSSQAQQLEFGGVTSQQYEYLGMLRDRLDRHAGLTETTRGNVSGSTATESQIAQEALNARTEYLKSKVRSATASALKSIGWFLFHTPGIIIPVNKRDPITGMESEGIFFGGQFPGVDSGEWEDYSISIEPLSMQRVTEQVLQRRAMDMATFVTETAPLIPTMPYVKWQEIYRLIGEAMNQEDADSLIIWELLGQFSAPGMLPASQVMGPSQQPQRESIPGQGFKPRPGDSPRSNAPMVDERRSEMSKPFGDEYGGTQGPPGSARRFS